MKIIEQKYSSFEGIKKIAILGDPACRECWKKNTPPFLEYVWRVHRPDLFLVAGDLAVDGASSEYKEFLYSVRRYPALLAAVPGDHDRPIDTFRDYFGSTRKIIDAGKWRFVGCNTAHRVFTKGEAEFLESNLTSNSIIFTHVPPGIEGWTFHSFSPLHSERFLSVVERNRSKIKAAFFGHIHGYSRNEYLGIPFIATGGLAESFAIRNNRYDGPGFTQMMVLDAATGEISLCKTG
jgi:predicted phosphohydrolase